MEAPWSGRLGGGEEETVGLTVAVSLAAGAGATGRVGRRRMLRGGVGLAGWRQAVQHTCHDMRMSCEHAPLAQAQRIVWRSMEASH